jgi:hypothetical protein
LRALTSTKSTFNARKLSVIILSIFAFLLDYYTYLDLNRPQVNWDNFEISKSIVLCSLLYLYWIKLSDFYFFVQSVLFTLLLLPTCILCSYYPNYGINIPLSSASLLIVVQLGVYILPYKYGLSLFPQIKIIKLDLDTSSALLVLSFILVIPFIFSFDNYLNYKNLLLDDIYTTRFKAREQGNILTSYIYGQLVYVLLPASLALSLQKRRYIISIAAVILLLYLYLLTGMKAVYLSIPLIFLFSFGRIYHKILYWNTFICFLLVFGLIEYYLGSSCRINREIISRTFFVPAIETFHYFDYFKHRPIYFAQYRLLSGLIAYPCELPAPFQIGKIYYNLPKMSANTGIIGDAFMNLGYAGVLFFSSIFSGIVKLLSLFENVMIYPCLFIFLTLLSNGALSTVLLTHGGFCFISLIWYLHINESESNNLTA